MICLKSFNGKVKELEFNVRSYFYKVHVFFFLQHHNHPLIETQFLFYHWIFLLSWHQHDTLYLKIDLDGIALISSTSKVLLSNLRVH